MMAHTIAILEGAGKPLWLKTLAMFLSSIIIEMTFGFNRIGIHNYFSLHCFIVPDDQQSTNNYFKKNIKTENVENYYGAYSRQNGEFI